MSVVYLMVEVVYLMVEVVYLMSESITVSVSCLRLDEALVPYLGAAQQLPEAEQQDVELPLPVRKCPNCGQDMVLKKKREGNRSDQSHLNLLCVSESSHRSAEML